MTYEGPPSTAVDLCPRSSTPPPIFPALLLDPTPVPIPSTYNPSATKPSPNTHVHNDSALLTPSDFPEPANMVEVEVEEVPVAVDGGYGTVDDPATRYVPLVGVGNSDAAAAADEE